MGYGSADVYYQPEEFDLCLVTDLELDGESYQFHMIAVWRHYPSGKLYWGVDSGCSCPSPFEDYTELEKLDILTKSDWRTIEKLVKESAVHGTFEASYFLREVRAALDML